METGTKEDRVTRFCMQNELKKRIPHLRKEKEGLDGPKLEIEIPDRLYIITTKESKIRDFDVIIVA